VAVIKELRRNDYGDASVLLKVKLLSTVWWIWNSFVFLLGWLCTIFFVCSCGKCTETQLACWWCYTGSNWHNSRLHLP
jgi:hypothetical protein